MIASAPPLTPEGMLLLEETAVRQYNRIARRFGADSLPMPQKPAVRYHLQSFGDLLRVKPIKWFIKGVIPQRGIAALYGQSGCGKSFLAIDLAVALSSGDTNWFGYRVKRCPVVYVCLEGEAGLSIRLAAYQRAGGAVGRAQFITQPLNLLAQKDLIDLVSAIKTSGMAGGLVVIDTLNRAAPGADENSSVDMGGLINAAKLIEQGIGGLVLLVHHTGKDSTKGLRGHSSLYAALDAAIEVKRSGDAREWSVAKAKDGEDGRSHPFKLEVVDMGADSDGDPLTSCVVRPAVSGAKVKPLTPALQMGMDAFMAAAAANIVTADKSMHASVEQWRLEFYKRSTADNPDSKRRTFSRVRDQLVAMSKLDVTDHVYRLSNVFSKLPE